MRRLFFFLLAFFALTACDNNSNDDDYKLNSEEERLVGKWFFEKPVGGAQINNSLTFNQGHIVTYRYWTGQITEYQVEEGKFMMENGRLKMIFPNNINLVFIQNVEFDGNDKVFFNKTGNPGEYALEGDYFKE